MRRRKRMVPYTIHTARCNISLWPQLPTPAAPLTSVLLVASYVLPYPLRGCGQLSARSLLQQSEVRGEAADHERVAPQGIQVAVNGGDQTWEPC